MTLDEKLQHLPTEPGLYLHKNSRGEIIYIGKAKSLRQRVRQYFQSSRAMDAKTQELVSRIADLEFIVTDSESEALILESNLIKRHMPRYNVMLKDDKAYPHLKLTIQEPIPRIFRTRKIEKDGAAYYGPFLPAALAEKTVRLINREFQLRTCADEVFEIYRRAGRPCMEYQIKRCAGPCTGEISLEDYAALAQEARDFLSGKSLSVREQLAIEMTAAAENLEFERAARLRDRISALSAIQGAQGVNPRSIEQADVFAIAKEAGRFCIEAFFFRAYQNWGNRSYFPRADASLSEEEVLDAFLAQFYDELPSPPLVLLSHRVESADVLADMLSARLKKRVDVAAPQRGEKRELVDHALTNARQTLGRKLAEDASQQQLLAATAQIFDLPAPPRRIEVYDNSHTGGAQAIGAMIVAGPGGFMKAHYRTFNIKNTEIVPGDDYGMMREVLTRRFARLAKEDENATADPDAFPSKPDLVLIDGGRGQYEAARAALAASGVEGIALASIAKGADRNAGRETFFMEGREPFRLPPHDPALYFVQRLRDEAHRFAIGTHRARRKKEFVKNPLDEIAGIGPSRKRALLLAFGSAKAVSRAALGDLEKTPGLNKATAKLVYEHFQRSE